MKNNHRSGALDVSALHLLHRAGQCAEVLFTNETGKADLTPRQYAILASVAQNPDISQTGLVEQTGVDRSTLADIVRRLVKKGLLQRKRTRRDARMYAVRLTQRGQSALSAIKRFRSCKLPTTTNSVTPEWATSASRSRSGIMPTTSPPTPRAASARRPISPTRAPP